jgi:hypothetical protein
VWKVVAEIRTISTGNREEIEKVLKTLEEDATTIDTLIVVALTTEGKQRVICSPVSALEMAYAIKLLDLEFQDMMEGA